MVNAQLIIAPVGAGKTEFVLNEVNRQFMDKRFARIWVLLATQRQEVALRERLFKNGDTPVYFNIEFFNFFSLYQRLLDMAGKPQRLISTTEQMMLLRYIIADLKSPLSVFAPVAQTNGFARIVREWIEELKQNRVTVDDYLAVASSPREHDLARIYEAYQSALINHHLMDNEGQGWLAVETLEDEPDLLTNAQIDLLIVDGFDQFSHTQADLLANIAKQIPQLLITLTQVTGREATIGRRFSTAKKELEHAFERAHERLITTPITAPSTSKHADLAHLVNTIFSQYGHPKPSSGGITFLETATPTHEAAHVLRRVKGLLLNGASPNDILIAVRGWEDYRKPLTAYAEKYKLPIVLHYDEPLTETPFVMTLLSVLSLPDNHFPRRAVLDALRSPYINGAGLSSEDIDLLEIICDHQKITHGYLKWMSAIKSAVYTPSDDMSNDDEEIPPLAITQEQANRLLEKLGAFFDKITLPEKASLGSYILMVEKLIGADPHKDADDDETDNQPDDDSLNMIANLRQSDETWLWRDLLVITGVKRCLQDLYFAHSHIISLIGTDEPISWDIFYHQLLASLTYGKASPRPSRTGRVLITTAADARGLPHQHVFILGLSEGIFPAPIPQDPLYLENERVRLSESLKDNLIKTRMEQRDDEGVFYELICLPAQSLTLSRPTLKDGKEWLPSPLWRGAASVYSDASANIAKNKIGIGKTVNIHESVTPDEALTALSIGLTTGDESVLPAGAWLAQSYPTEWEMLYQHRHIELGRIDTHQRDGIYNGILASPNLKGYIQQLLDESYVWSATRLSDQGVCGFRFFAKHLLKLSERKEPEIGMDVLQRGSVMHSILEQVYQAIRDQNMSISPDYIETAHGLLDEIGKRVLSTAPHDFGFNPTPLWEQEKVNIIQKLHRLIDADFTPEKDIIAEKLNLVGERTPYRLEAGFGFDNNPVWIDLGDDIGKIRIRGKIDRIDRIGDSLVVMDYKSGSTEIKPSEISDGRNYQMLVYLEAVRQIAPNHKIGGGFFWHLSDVKGKGIINPESHEALLTTGKTRLSHQLSALREADFSVEPNKPQPNGLCTRYCEFGKLCRHYRAIDEDEE